MAKRFLPLAVVLVFTACSGGSTTLRSSATNTDSTSSSSTTSSSTTTTSTTVPPAPPTTARTVPAVTSRSRPPAPAPVVDAAFWRRLANCESSDGRSGTFSGYFQFSADTAKKVGYRPGMTYEEQRALAIKWLGMIHGAGGSRSGWPHCWWVARNG